MDTLEEKTSATEGVESTQAEGAKSTESEEKSTVSLKDTPEFKAALDKAVGKGVSSIQSQLSISKAEAEAAKADVEVSKSLQEDYERRVTELEEEKFAGDEEALKGYRNTRRQDLRGKKQDLRDAEQNKREAEQDGLRWAITMNNKANELQGQYQVPREALELCTSEEQMEKIAKAFPEVGKKEPDKETPKFAGAGGGGVGADLNKLSSTELIQRGVSKMEKK